MCSRNEQKNYVKSIKINNNNKINKHLVGSIEAGIIFLIRQTKKFCFSCNDILATNEVTLQTKIKYNIIEVQGLRRHLSQRKKKEN